eukprot:s356_g16.t1
MCQLQIIWTSCASSISQWALPDFICQLQIAVGTAGLHLDLMCQLQIAVGTAGLHLPAPDRSGHGWTSAVSARSQRTLPDFSRGRQIAAWHLATWTFVLCGRRGTCSTQLALVTRLVAADAASFCVAGVALGDMDLRFVWQAGHLVTSTFVLCGRRGTCGTGHGPSFCVAGVAFGDIDLRFVWQAWHLPHWAGSGDGLGRRGRRLILRGRRGTWRHGPSFCVAGVALGDMDFRFVWQAWHLRHWAGSGDALGRRGRRLILRGRRGTW